MKCTKWQGNIGCPNSRVHFSVVYQTRVKLLLSDDFSTLGVYTCTRAFTLLAGKKPVEIMAVFHWLESFR